MLLKAFHSMMAIFTIRTNFLFLIFILKLLKYLNFLRSMLVNTIEHMFLLLNKNELGRLTEGHANQVGVRRPRDPRRHPLLQTRSPNAAPREGATGERALPQVFGGAQDPAS